jgi:hypothetical protein
MKYFYLSGVSFDLIINLINLKKGRRRCKTSNRLITQNCCQLCYIGMYTIDEVLFLVINFYGYILHIYNVIADSVLYQQYWLQIIMYFALIYTELSIC